MGVSRQVQRLHLEIQAFLEQAHKHDHDVGTCEIGIDVEEHEVPSKEIGILA